LLDRHKKAVEKPGESRLFTGMPFPVLVQKIRTKAGAILAGILGGGAVRKAPACGL
jgi:hypothetical protein